MKVRGGNGAYGGRGGCGVSRGAGGGRGAGDGSIGKGGGRGRGGFADRGGGRGGGRGRGKTRGIVKGVSCLTKTKIPIKVQRQQFAEVSKAVHDKQTRELEEVVKTFDDPVFNYVYNKQKLDDTHDKNVSDKFDRLMDDDYKSNDKENVDDDLVPEDGDDDLVPEDGDDDLVQEDDDEEEYEYQDELPEEETVAGDQYVDRNNPADESISLDLETVGMFEPQMSNAPEWALAMYNKMIKLELCCKRMEKILSGNKKKEPEPSAPSQIPFKYIEDLMDFENVSPDDFQKMVKYLQKSLYTTSTDSANAMLQDAISVKEDFITPWISARGKGEHHPKNCPSLVKSKLGQAIIAALTAPDKNGDTWFSLSTTKEQQFVVEGALRSVRSRRKRAMEDVDKATLVQRPVANG